MAQLRFSDDDDRALVVAIGQGDQAAMAEAVRRHRETVVAFARRLVGDASRAEEIAQDVFLRLWERAASFDAKRGSLRTFLLAITHGRAVDVARSDAARRAREHRDASRRPAADGVDSQVEARSVAGAVRLALSRLPDAERRAVQLAYFGGHSYRAVAQMLGEPEGTIKSRIRAGLARLRVELAAQDLRS